MDVTVTKEIEGMTSRLLVDISAIDLDSICLPPGDHLGTKSDDDLQFEAGFANFIAVDNLPIVHREQFEKLESDIRKIFSHIVVIKDGGIWMPVDPETEKTLGYCFIKFNIPKEIFQHWLTYPLPPNGALHAASVNKVMLNDVRQMKHDSVYKRHLISGCHCSLLMFSDAYNNCMLEIR